MFCRHTPLFNTIIWEKNTPIKLKWWGSWTAFWQRKLVKITKRETSYQQSAQYLPSGLFRSYVSVDSVADNEFIPYFFVLFLPSCWESLYLFTPKIFSSWSGTIKMANQINSSLSSRLDSNIVKINFKLRFSSSSVLTFFRSPTSLCSVRHPFWLPVPRSIEPPGRCKTCKEGSQAHPLHSSSAHSLRNCVTFTL